VAGSPAWASDDASPLLERGDLPPDVVRSPPGPRTLELAADLGRVEAPGINTLHAGRTRMVLAEALGSNLLDVDGNRYVDLTAGFGVASIGHRHPAVVEAVAQQASRLVHGLGDVHAHPARIAAARALCDLAPFEHARVYWAISGGDAIEIALKTALLHTGSTELVAFEPGYHGLTLGALRATSRPAFRQPFDAPLEAHTSRFPFGGPLREVARRLASSPKVGACVVEPVVGREGILLPADGWLAELAEICRRHATLLIADEVFTGLARTGFRWACDAEGVRPDLLCCGKALGGGMPIAAVLGRREVLDAWSSPGEARHTATFVAHPLACAAASTVLAILERDRLAERAVQLGAWLGEGLRSIAGSHAVRGRGLAWALVARDRDQAARWAGALLDRGYLALAGGPEGSVLQIAPPLIITGEQLEGAVAAIAEVLGGA